MNEQSDEQILQKYERDFRKKNCIQRDFTFSLDEVEKRVFTNNQSSCCRHKGSIICAIISLILICGGIYFAISRNEGYKALKLSLEKNITSIGTNFPNEEQTKKLVLFLNNPEIKDDNYLIKRLDEPCNYEEYQQLRCHYSQFIKYCYINNNPDGQCADINFSLYINSSISYCLLGIHNEIVDRTPYSYECSSDKNFLKFLEDNRRMIYGIPENLTYSVSNISNEVSISYLRGFTLQKFWCNIGKYDIKILISSLIFIIIYIIVLFLDISFGENRSIGIKYYITLIGYMILFVAIRIFIILYCLLFVYSVFVFFVIPKTYVYDYNEVSETTFNEYFFKKKETEDEPTGLWREKRLYAAIFCGINLLIFIFFLVMSSISGYIYSLLSFKNQIEPEINNLKGIKRKASIKVDKNYDIIIFQNENLILHETETNKIYEFKKIMYNNKMYYLKLTNKGLNDQIDWTDFYKYPKINEFFLRSVSSLIINFFIFFISIFFKQIKIKDEYTYSFYKYLFKLGYNPKFYEYFEKFGDINEDLSDFLFIINIINGIILFITVVKRALFGGFSNIFLLLGSFALSIILYIVNLIIVVFLVVHLVYYIFSLVVFFGGKISFIDDNSIFIKLIMYAYLHFYFFPITLIQTLQSQNPKYLFNVIMEKNILGLSKSRKEDIFKYIGFDQNQHILKVANSNNLPNKLFYTLEDNNNQLLDNYSLIHKKEENKQLCLELNKYECGNESDLNEYISYKKKD